MRIVQLTPGTAHFYCGNCLRDTTLGAALRRQGHDVTMAPLYLPVFSEVEQDVNTSIHLGGINMYLRHRMPRLAKLTGLLGGVLDRPGVLRWAAKRGDMTDAAKHADLTVAMLQGRQSAQLDQLLDHLADRDRPDAVFLCNALLAGLAEPIKRRLDVPVVMTLHGEDAFLDSLPDPHRERAWTELAARIAHADALIAVSRYYGDRMIERLSLDAAKVHTVHNGISLEGVRPIPEVRDGPLSIGYLARMCPDKGLHTLVDAFIDLRKRGHDGLRLEVAGVMLEPDKAYVKVQRDKLERAEALASTRFDANVSRERKLEFLHGLDILSVPAGYGEAFGLYVIEALAHGVPVVQPMHAAFPEIIERTGGGLLCEPDDPKSLADALETLITDPVQARQLGSQGRRAVIDGLTDVHMAQSVADILHGLIGMPSGRAPESLEAASA